MVLPYGLGMPALKRPVPQDAVTARRILIGGLARDVGIFEILSELAPLHPRNDTFPGEVFLRLGADALDRCGASWAAPVALGGIADGFRAMVSAASWPIRPRPATCSDGVYAPKSGRSAVRPRH